MPKRKVFFSRRSSPRRRQAKRGAGTSGQCAERQRGRGDGVHLPEFLLNHLPRHIRGFGDLTQRLTMIKVSKSNWAGGDPPPRHTIRATFSLLKRIKINLGNAQNKGCFFLGGLPQGGGGQERSRHIRPMCTEAKRERGPLARIFTQLPASTHQRIW